MTANNPIGSSFTIPFTDTKAYNYTFLDGFLNDTTKVIESGRYILGEEVSRLERELEGYFSKKYAVAVSSGTTALELAFRALNLSSTDEIIVPANAYIACIFGARASGAKIVPVDCTYNGTLDLEAVESAIRPVTRAVLVVHLYGDSCDMVRLSNLCQSHSLALVEDCAQSFGSEYCGKKLGSYGTIACHSFYPTKNLGALGDAGAIVTDREDIALACRKMRNLGSTRKYEHDILGTNARMDTLQAMFLLRKLPYVNELIQAKQEISKRFIEVVGDRHLRNQDGNVHHSYHLFVIRVRNRDAFCKSLAAAGIETIIHYPIPYYKSEALRDMTLSFPITETLADSIVSIPLHASFKNSEIEYIIETLRNETLNGSL
jgi:dTDP-4-amino-4,6-dideoxygalactose transaminase